MRSFAFGGASNATDLDGRASNYKLLAPKNLSTTLKQMKISEKSIEEVSACFSKYLTKWTNQQASERVAGQSSKLTSKITPARFQPLTMALIIQVFWDIKPCLMAVVRPFRWRHKLLGKVDSYLLIDTVLCFGRFGNFPNEISRQTEIKTLAVVCLVLVERQEDN